MISNGREALAALLRRETQNCPGKMVALHLSSPGRITPDLVIGFCGGRDMTDSSSSMNAASQLDYGLQEQNLSLIVKHLLHHH